MPADADTVSAELLERAETAPPASPQRKLLVAAAFSSVALEGAVLVGGAAVELHTGSYRPTDIDLVGHLRRDVASSLAALGFQRDGRHWLVEFQDGEVLAIEVPADVLDDFAVEEPIVIDLEPGSLAVITLNDLMMDRLLQATGGEPVTMDEAVRLAVATYDRIDWAELAARSEAAANEGTLAGIELPELLGSVRRKALRTQRR